MRKGILLCGLTAIILICVGSVLAESDLVYGKVYTVDDDVLEGYIRWDRNEASWGDIIDGDKKLDRKYRRKYQDRDDRDRGNYREAVEIFGVRVFANHGWPNQASSGIRVGYLKELIPDGDDEALLVLKNGEEIEFENGSGDIGEDIREILIDTNDEGVIELYWRDIDRIEFMQGPDRESAFGKRLYGKLVTRRGDEFKGSIGWDIDESFDTDVLDGSERNRKRKIEFKDISMIERRSSQSALVTLRTGKKIRLDDSNDVDDSNRGIVISDDNLGRIVVSWDDFDFLEFMDPPKGMTYDKFPDAKPLAGTVTTERGKSYKGKIVWDADESYNWELLDGRIDDVDFSIEFSNIEKIEKNSRRGSEVTLRDGRVFRLRDSNDIDDDNKGIIVLVDGDKDDEVFIDWDDFESAVF